MSLHFPDKLTLISKLREQNLCSNEQILESIADIFANQDEDRASIAEKTDLKITELSKDKLNPFLNNQDVINALLNCANNKNHNKRLFEEKKDFTPFAKRNLYPNQKHYLCGFGSGDKFYP